ncbi:BTAD domain-containing putative transcriptional regulator [Streptomyces sp. NPDC050738]|uniref:AfsR/SARP family transcriptional regulator n=1 Tax=Streptomyces sp. NPDC050738 TaxID=3154744 RepID=UPI0034351470
MIIRAGAGMAGREETEAGVMSSGEADTGERTRGLRFRVLGPLVGERDGQALALGPPQQRALLAVLLLSEGRPVSLAKLLDALWGEQLPTRAVGILRTYVSRLRALLEPDRTPRAPATVLVSEGGGYALRLPAAALDTTVLDARLRTAADLRARGEIAAAHRELEQSLAMWSGTPLSGLPGPYAQRQRERLTELWRSAREDHFQCALELDRHAESVAALRSFAAEHPLRERSQALLMRALHRAGRQTEAFGVYAAACRSLDAELGVGPGAELRAAHTRLLQPDPPREPTARVPRQPTAGPAPAQLPADIPDFTGRHELSARLAELLHDAATRQVMAVSVLTGLGGVGKTALALHASHRARADFPDGQLYVDLRGGIAGAPDTPAVLAHLLWSLGVPAPDVPDGTERRAALYRSLLAGRRMLVVLDDVRDAAQVRPLLPGVGGCAVIVTSRSRAIELPGARVFPVDTMNEQEALGLLAAVVGRERVAAEPVHARELVAACGRLPLAVRMAGTRLAVRRGWALADMTARLREEQRRPAEPRAGGVGVEAAFRRCYERLAPCPARALRRVAAAGVTVIGRSSAAALIGIGEQEAREVMDSLVDAGLLEEHGVDSYRCHDLVRLFARQRPGRQAGPAGRAAALSELFRTAPASGVRSAPRTAHAPVPWGNCAGGGRV